MLLRQTTIRWSQFVMLVCVTLLIALPGLWINVHTAPPSAYTPPAVFDRFLLMVQRATPSNARFLVAGGFPALASSRAAYILYPRDVEGIPMPDQLHVMTALPLTRDDLQRLAHRVRAHYILLWEFPIVPRGRVLIRSGAGLLVDVSP